MPRPNKVTTHGCLRTSHTFVHNLNTSSFRCAWCALLMSSACMILCSGVHGMCLHGCLSAHPPKLVHLNNFTRVATRLHPGPHTTSFGSPKSPHRGHHTTSPSSPQWIHPGFPMRSLGLPEQLHLGCPMTSPSSPERPHLIRLNNLARISCLTTLLEFFLNDLTWVSPERPHPSSIRRPCLSFLHEFHARVFHASFLHKFFARVSHSSFSPQFSTWVFHLSSAHRASSSMYLELLWSNSWWLNDGHLPSNALQYIRVGGRLCHPTDPFPMPKPTLSTCFLCLIGGSTYPTHGTTLSTHPTSYKLISKTFRTHSFMCPSHGGVVVPVTRMAGPYILPHLKSLSSSIISHLGNHLSPRYPYQGIHPTGMSYIGNHLNPWSSTTLSQSPDVAPHHARLAPQSQATCFLQHIMLTSSCVVLIWTTAMILQHNANTSLYTDVPHLWTSWVVNPTVTLKPWECTSSCHHQSFLRTSYHIIKSIKIPSPYKCKLCSGPWSSLHLICNMLSMMFSIQHRYRSAKHPSPQSEEIISSNFDSWCATSKSMKQSPSYLYVPSLKSTIETSIYLSNLSMWCLWS